MGTEELQSRASRIVRRTVRAELPTEKPPPQDTLCRQALAVLLKGVDHGKTRAEQQPVHALSSPPSPSLVRRLPPLALSFPIVPCAASLPPSRRVFRANTPTTVIHNVVA